MTGNLLSLIIFTPLIGVLLVLILPERLKSVYRYVALAVLLVQSIFAAFLITGYQKALTGINTVESFQFVEKLEWIRLDLGTLGRLSIDYFVGVDGMSITMVLLSVIVLFIGVISSWNVTDKAKGYFTLYLILNTSIIGCFVALDMFLFYLFFEFMLLPMYFLIGIWGGKRREYASIKFFLFTLVGSIFILVVMIGLYISVIDPTATGSNVHTFNMLAMMDPANYLPNSILSITSGVTFFGVSARLLAFLLLFIGFAIKVPVVPVHTWLPDAHVEAPTAISVVLAGVLLKIGAYGLIRIGYSIFPDGAIHYSWWVGFLGLISIIYGAFNALSCNDIKRMIAYSSVSHMGFVLLGLASLSIEGVSGSVYQMFSHGLISSALFLIAGVLYDRSRDRIIGNYSGLAQKMPYYTVIVVIMFFASLGLPGFSGFIAEILVFLGAFRSEFIPKWMAIAATFGLLLGAAYYLWTIQRMFFGKYFVRDKGWDIKLTDLDKRELLMFVPLAIMIVLFGIFPHLLLEMINSSVGHFVNFVQQTGLSILK